jgi:hypothetical protein
MSAYYDETLEDEISRARAELGDTEFTSDTQDDALHTDEHIEAVLAWKGYTAGVAFLAEELIVRYATEPDSVRLSSGLTVSFRDRLAAWTRLATRKAAAVTAAADAGAAASGDTCTVAVW